MVWSHLYSRFFSDVVSYYVFQLISEILQLETMSSPLLSSIPSFWVNQTSLRIQLFLWIATQRRDLIINYFNTLCFDKCSLFLLKYCSELSLLCAIFEEMGPSSQSSPLNKMLSCWNVVVEKDSACFENALINWKTGYHL